MAAHGEQWYETIGIGVTGGELFVSNLAGYLPPVWLSPQLAMRRK